MEYLQKFERYREDKFLTKNFKGTYFWENIILFSGHSMMMLLTCTKFYKNIFMVLKLQCGYFSTDNYKGA